MQRGCTHVSIIGRNFPFSCDFCRVSFFAGFPFTELRIFRSRSSLLHPKAFIYFPGEPPLSKPSAFPKLLDLLLYYCGSFKTFRLAFLTFDPHQATLPNLSSYPPRTNTSELGIVCCVKL